MTPGWCLIGSGSGFLCVRKVHGWVAADGVYKDSVQDEPRDGQDKTEVFEPCLSDGELKRSLRTSCGGLGIPVLKFLGVPSRPALGMPRLFAQSGLRVPQAAADTCQVQGLLPGTSAEKASILILTRLQVNILNGADCLN